MAAQIFLLIVSVSIILRRRIELLRPACSAVPALGCRVSNGIATPTLRICSSLLFIHTITPFSIPLASMADSWSRLVLLRRLRGFGTGAALWKRIVSTSTSGLFADKLRKRFANISGIVAVCIGLIPPLESFREHRPLLFPDLHEDVDGRDRQSTALKSLTGFMAGRREDPAKIGLGPIVAPVAFCDCTVQFVALDHVDALDGLVIRDGDIQSCEMSGKRIDCERHELTPLSCYPSSGRA
ncbi:hypothetical protein A9R05_41540 (plasmid) [Burkholderia sp. KK1]|nr:hypothetical protein A9R05_41540 [Burkholderia sp. KK1]